MKKLYFLFCLFLMFSLSYGQIINEFQPNAAGTDPDPMSIELKGTPSASFSGFLISLETDVGSVGTVDRSAAVSGTFDTNGLLVVSIPDLENPSFAFVLCSLDPGVTTDLDTNDDGTIDDPSVLGTVYDAIGIPDNDTDAMNTYAEQLGGATFSYTGDEPGLVFRDGTSDDWYAINEPYDGTSVFDINATILDSGDFSPAVDLAGTFGSANPVYTAPSGPNINASGSLGNFTYVFGSGPSAEDSFTASATNLGGSLTITAPSGYELTTTSGSGYANPLVLNPDPSGEITSTTVYVILTSGLAVGNYSGDITLSSAGATDELVAVNGNVTAVTNLCFDLSAGSELFELVTVTTNSDMDVWTLDMGTYSMNGFCGGGCQENVDTWLIFGPLDMTGVTNLALEFDAAENFGNTDLLIQYTSAYSGCPDTSSWTLADTVTEADEGFVSVDLSAAMGTDVFIGVQYSDDGVDGYSDWDLSNMALVSTTTCPTLGSRPTSSCASCGVSLQTENYVCLNNTTGTDGVTIEIAYTGMEDSLDMANPVTTTSGATIGGDDPRVTADGTIQLTGLNEGDAWDITLNGGDCDGTTLSGTIPAGFCDPALTLPLTETFTYTDGPLTANPNWQDYSGAPLEMQVASGEVTVLQDGTQSEDASIAFTATGGGDIFFGIDFRVPNPGGPITGGDYEYFACFKDGGFNLRGRIDIVEGTGGGDFTVGLSSTGSTADVSWGSDLSFDTTYRATVRYNQDSNIAELWIDAAAQTDTSVLGTDQMDPGTEITEFALRQSNSSTDETIIVDNLIVSATFNETLSTNDITQTDNFNLYPNPTNTGFITITSSNSDVINVQVFDILGKEVKNEVITNNSLDVSSLRTGMYLVKITQNNASTTKKLVIR